MLSTSSGDVPRVPLLILFIPVFPLFDSVKAGHTRIVAVDPPEDAPVVDDGVGAPVPLVVHVEEQSLAVDVDLGSVVVLLRGLVLTQVPRPQLRHKSTGLDCDRAKTTPWMFFILITEQEWH